MKQPTYWPACQDERSATALSRSRLGAVIAVGLLFACSHLGYAGDEAAPAAQGAAPGPHPRAPKTASPDGVAEHDEAAAATECIPPPASSAEWESLLSAYRAYGLPLPPNDAPLVTCLGTEPGHFLHAAGAIKPIFASNWRHATRLAFLLREGTGQQPPLVFDGVDVRHCSSARVHVKRVDPIKMSVKQIEEFVGHSVPFDYRYWPFMGGDGPWDRAFLMAIHCKARGWDAFAQALIKRQCLPNEEPWQRLLASQAWMYWHDQLRQPNTDRSAIARRLHQLIRLEKSLDDERNRSFLRRLDATIPVKSVKPGSIEAAVENLMEACADPGAYNPKEPLDDPAYARVAEFGFAAIPELIKHLDDHRLTRACRSPFEAFGLHPDFNFTPEIEIADAAKWLLDELSGNQIQWDTDSAKRRDSKSRQTAAQNWAQLALGQSEEEYLLERAPLNLNTGDTHDSLIIWLIGNKYPQHLPALYRAAVDDPTHPDTEALARAVTRSTLARDEKLQLLFYASGRTNRESWIAAVRPMRLLDPERFASILAEKIASFSTISRGPNDEIPEPLYVVPLVCETSNRRPWKALTSKAKRSNVDTRIEWLDLVGAGWISQPAIQRRRRAKFFAQFLDDRTVRQLDEKNPRDDVTLPEFTRLEVRDFAALQIAEILELPMSLPWDLPLQDEKWPPTRWADLRSKVRAALEREHLIDSIR